MQDIPENSSLPAGELRDTKTHTKASLPHNNENLKSNLSSVPGNNADITRLTNTSTKLATDASEVYYSQHGNESEVSLNQVINSSELFESSYSNETRDFLENKLNIKQNINSKSNGKQLKKKKMKDISKRKNIPVLKQNNRHSHSSLVPGVLYWDCPMFRNGLEGQNYFLRMFDDAGWGAQLSFRVPEISRHGECL